jgi:hypothetical protein
MGLLGKIWVKLGLDNSELDKGFKDSEKSAGKFQGALKGIAVGMASAFSVAAVIGFAKKSIQAYNESALALTKLESVLKSTGGAAGLTSEQMQNFAADLQRVTKFEDDATIAAMAVLASFKGISGDVFKGVVTAAMDMSTVIGGDLQSNVYQLAKALERPAEGIQLLNRSTRAFSLAQIEDIKKLVAEGKTHEAQLSILAALEGKFGGAAKAAADTAAGAWVQLGNTIGDIMENIGSATEKSKGFAKSLNSYLTSMKNLWASDEVWTATKVYATFFSWANDNAVKAANAEAERKKKAIEDDAKLTAEKMKGINSVADADKALFDLGLRRYSSEEASFVAALENYKTKAIATEQQTELEKAEAAEAAKAAAAKDAAAKAEQMGIDGTIKRYQYLISEIEKKILATNVNDQTTLQALVEEKKGLETLVERWKTTTQAAADYLSMIEAIRAENDQMPIRPVDSSKVDAKGQASIQPLTQPGIQAAPKTNDPTGLKAYNDEFDAEVLRSADIAANFGRTVASSISDSMRVIMDAIASGEKIDASDMTKAILMPFADMATQIGEVMVATGAAALAAKAIGSAGGPWGAIAAGAALIALGTAASAAIGAIGASWGSSGQSDPYSYNGGGAMPAVAAVNSGPVEIFGVLKGQDIYLSSQKYQQNKAR